MPIWLGILAGVMADKMKEAEARKQAATEMRMQYARSLDPSMPTYGYQAAQFNHQQNANGGASVAALLPMLLGQHGSQPSNLDTTSGLQLNPAWVDFEGQNKRGYGGLNWGERSGGVFG